VNCRLIEIFSKPDLATYYATLRPLIVAKPGSIDACLPKAKVYVKQAEQIQRLTDTSKMLVQTQRWTLDSMLFTLISEHNRVGDKCTVTIAEHKPTALMTYFRANLGSDSVENYLTAIKETLAGNGNLERSELGMKQFAELEADGDRLQVYMHGKPLLQALYYAIVWNKLQQQKSKAAT